MRPQDFDRFSEIWRNPDVVRYIGGEPWNREQAWTSFLKIAGHWQMAGYGQWAIDPHGATQMMGQIGFFLRRAGLGDDFDAYPEAGWVLHPDAQGSGVGRDAANAAHDWFDRVITGPLVCKIAPENDRSLSIAGNLGYEEMRTISHDGSEVRLMYRKGPPGSPRNLFEEVQSGNNSNATRPVL